MSELNLPWLNARTERLGKLIDEAKALEKDLNALSVEVTDPLAAAVVQLEAAQRHLTYELGVAARVEYANRPRNARAS